MVRSRHLEELKLRLRVSHHAADVVNETFAKRFWPDGSALGRSFRQGDARITIVGVARDAKYALLTESTPALVYFPVAQLWRSHLSLMIRTDSDPRTLAPAIQDVMRSIDARGRCSWRAPNRRSSAVPLEVAGSHAPSATATMTRRSPL
jgi:hypothetical protein